MFVAAARAASCPYIRGQLRVHKESLVKLRIEGSIRDITLSTQEFLGPRFSLKPGVQIFDVD
jgi:hypothetical protein